GISVSSPCYGTVYIFNNLMRHFRKTVFQYVTNVVVMNTDTIPASPLKLNAAFCDIPGKVYFMHNTVDAGTESYGFVSYQPQSKSSWSKVVSRNNLFYNEGKYYNLWVRAMDSVDFDYNLYYNPNGFSARQDRPNYGEYTTMAGVQSNILGNTNKPGSFIEKHSFVANPKPGWTNPALFDYHLNNSSPAIDKGILINGLNDNFMGTAPDLGAFEFGTNGAYQIHRNTYSFLIYPNPTVSGKIMVSGSVIPEKVLVFNANGQLLIEKPCTQQWFELDIESLVAGIYSITLVVDGKYYSQQLLVMP
ncbi:MAG: T9SS type A sorting domain-containing protein, partial [Bacteroidia bacterium]|nr:T9SS type A sorting domain-containing protein [Bacteroidia bacterium]